MTACRSEMSGSNASAARLLSILAIAICVALAVTPLAFAQVTTGSIAGQVTADADNAALPGVTIEAVHTPTGTHYTTVSGGNGRYVLPNVRVGGPYKITATLEGFRPANVASINVNLGETANVPVRLKLAGVTETVTVTAHQDDIINPNHTGSTSEVQTKQIELLPTVNRSIQDFARTNPYFDVSPTDNNGTFMNVAGRNNRYNNIQIDGAVNNDVFGLAASGTPGGQSATQPIALDSLQALQLVVSPYDVRQSGFTGGGVNAVTRSGTNKWDGSAFGTKRSKTFVGNGPLDTPVSTFKQTQWGGRLGGPIISDKLFFFVSGEENRRDQPNGTSADGSTGTVYAGTGTGNQPSASLLADFLKSKYNYDPGSLGDLPFTTNSNLAFGRLDFNLNNSNTITLRHNYVTGTNDVNPSSYPVTRTTSRFYFPTSIYSIANKTNSTVGQINTVVNANMFNEARVGYQTIRDQRAIPVAFPTVEIGGTGVRAGDIQVGTERFSAANFLNQDIKEFTDDFTWVHGGHTIVAGTHNESFSFANLFIQDNFGYYYFPTLDAFEQGKATTYSIGFATGDDPRRPAAFHAGQYAFYVNDQWHVNNNLTLTGGLRADKPHFGNTPSFNPVVLAGLGYSTSAVPATKLLWEPRVGFNFDPMADGKQQIRGGVGVFQGRAPYVWISNAYSNTGIDVVTKTCATPSCTPPDFNPDITVQPRLDNVAGAVPSIAMTDPNFRFPRVLRTTLGYDRELWWGIRGTGEILFSKSLSDIYYRNVNFAQNGTSPLDGRPTYARIATNLGDSVLLTNTSLGKEVTETLQLSKSFSSLTLNGSYAHQHAASAFDATSSIAYSNWNFQPNQGNINLKQLTTSSFQVRHRINLAATYNLNTGPLTHSFGLYYDAEAGNPYSLIMGGDPNKDATTNDDLLYVPAYSSGVILCPSAVSNSLKPAAGAPCGAGVTPLDSQKFYDFLTSLGLDVTRARILTRNSLQQPWVRRMDVHYEIGLPQYRDVRVLVTADVLNFLNLFNKDWGAAQFVAFNTYTPVNYLGQDPTSGKPVYKEAATNRLTPGNQFSYADIASRWQARLGLRVNF